MDIKLIPESGSRFVFPALPEKIKVKYGAKYQEYDIISKGSVKVPKGTDVTEISWSHVFFGESKKNEPIVRKSHWKDPDACVEKLYKFLKNGTVMNLIVTGTWINLDVTISSFQPQPAGAYGNIEYSITFVQHKTLQIYTTSELQIATYAKQTVTREESVSESSSSDSSSYTVKSGDTLWAIAASQLGSGSSWTTLYSANSDTIEAAAQSYGYSSSNNGNLIFPGTVLTIPSS